MKKNILAENLIRFGVKNLNQLQKRRILENAEYSDKVKFNGKTYYVHATAEDFDHRVYDIAKNKYAGKSTFNQDDFIVLSTNNVPGYDYSMAYQELANGNDYIVVNSDEVDNENPMRADELLDIIMSYTKDPDDAFSALTKYQTTGDFGDNMLAAKIEKDPRWKFVKK
jgi:hypothetical protein